MTSVALLRALLIAGLLAFIGLFAYSYRFAVDHPRALAFGRDLRQMNAVDARLNEEVLKSRAGIVMHYDALVRHVALFRQLIVKVSEVPGFFSAAEMRELEERRRSAAEVLQQKDSFIESFKTENAVLRNSQRFLPIAVRSLVENETFSETVSRRVNTLLTALIDFDGARDREVAARLDARIDELATELLRETPPVLQRSIQTLIDHTSVIRDRRSKVDDLVAAILALPLGARVSQLEDAYAAHLRMALAAESHRQRSLFVLAMAVVATALTDVILRIRQSRTELERANRELASAHRALAREHEKQQELEAMKARFVAMISHEFRTPLSAIRSSSELLERYGQRWDVARWQSHLAQIRSASETMGDLLEEILLIGRAEAGMLRPAPGPLNLLEFCDEIVKTQQLATSSSHPIRQTVVGETNVVLDERFLRCLLSNLLENAMKYSPPGSDVELCVKADAADIRITVRDRGIGIEPDELPQLFASFRRGSNVGKVKGSGLGLAVVKHVVDAQSGHIEIQSEVGQGTEVVVRLPRPVPAYEGSAEAS